MMRARLLAGLLAVAALAGACGNDSPKGVPGNAVKPIAARSLPSTILGLEVHEEDVKNSLNEAKNTYATQASLFSLRDENLVVATLQATSLSDQFDYKSAKERTALAIKIGGGRAQQFRVGADTVYITQGQRQRIALWFRGRNLFVLSVRQDYEKPRSLIREALEIDI
jgi:hypothetical protein